MRALKILLISKAYDREEKAHKLSFRKYNIKSPSFEGTFTVGSSTYFFPGKAQETLRWKGRTIYYAWQSEPVSFTPVPPSPTLLRATLDTHFLHGLTSMIYHPPGLLEKIGVMLHSWVEWLTYEVPQERIRLRILIRKLEGKE